MSRSPITGILPVSLPLPPLRVEIGAVSINYTKGILFEDIFSYLSAVDTNLDAKVNFVTRGQELQPGPRGQSPHAQRTGPAPQRGGA